MEIIKNFAVRVFGSNSYLATFFLSMIPLLEIKGSIPFGMSQEVFGASALQPFPALLAAATGGLVPAFLLLAIFNPLMNWLKKTRAFKRLSEKFLSGVQGRADKIEAKNAHKTTIYKCLGLIAFVALPIPLTGVYTGSCIACCLGLNYLQSLVCILIGNLVAASIVVLLCTVFKGYETYIILGFVALLIVAVLIRLIARVVKRKRAA